MKLLYDFFPIVLFFIAYKTYDIFVATAVAIVAAFLQVTLFWLKHRRFEKMHLVSLGLIGVLGGLTLILRDNTFIMWKPTVINWLFAGAFLFSQFFGSKTLVERMLGKQVALPSIAWTRLNLSWVVFFIISGIIAINAWVRAGDNQAAGFLQFLQALDMCWPRFSAQFQAVFNVLA